MLRTLLFVIFAVFAAAWCPAEQPPDLTGADAKTFHAHLGKLVSLRGKLSEGVHGECLKGATPKGVIFYVIEDVEHVPPGGFTWPSSWMQLRGQQVRVTGTLKFQKWPRPPDGKYVGGWSQPSPDYYYMVLQQTEIQPLETK
jgi:hypothetical protein